MLPDWIWIIPIVYFILQAVAGAAQHKAKEVASEQRRRGEQTTLEPIEDPAPRNVSPEPVVRPAAPNRSAEDIAAEIRRMMGLEPARPEPVVERRYEVIEPDTAEDYDHGGTLHDRLAQREAAGQHGAGTLATRHLAPNHESSIAQRRFGSMQLGSLARRVTPRPVVERAEVRPNAYLNLENIAAALVTAEVLGPPKALRDDW